MKISPHGMFLGGISAFCLFVLGGLLGTLLWFA
jgi:hypothetical protein